MAAITGVDDLADFRSVIAAPRRFRSEHAPELDVFYRRSTGGFQIPGCVVEHDVVPVVETHLYRHSLYCQLPPGTGFEGLRRPLEVRFGADP
jgi:hypothetical protein